MHEILRSPTRTEASRLRGARIRAKATEHGICGWLLLWLLWLWLLLLLLTKRSWCLTECWAVQVKNVREKRDARYAGLRTSSLPKSSRLAKG